jgi:hypothetical protein
MTDATVPATCAASTPILDSAEATRGNPPVEIPAGRPESTSHWLVKGPSRPAGTLADLRFWWAGGITMRTNSRPLQATPYRCVPAGSTGRSSCA